MAYRRSPGPIHQAPLPPWWCLIYLWEESSLGSLLHTYKQSVLLLTHGLSSSPHRLFTAAGSWVIVLHGQLSPFCDRFVPRHFQGLPPDLITQKYDKLIGGGQGPIHLAIGSERIRFPCYVEGEKEKNKTYRWCFTPLLREKERARDEREGVWNGVSFQLKKKVIFLPLMTEIRS